MKKHLLVLLLLMVAFNACIYAQTGYAVNHYSADNGLPQNSIKSIMSDAEGYVWLATEDGLVRFDGHQFSVYNNTNLKLGSNRVAGIRLSIRSDQKVERAKVAYASFVRFSSKYSVKIQDGKATVDTMYSLERDRKILASGIGETNTMDDVTLVAHIPDIISNTQSGNDHHIIAAGKGDGNFFSVSKKHITYFEDWKKVYQCNSPGPDLWNYFTIGNSLYYRRDRSTYVHIVNGKASSFELGGALRGNPKFEQRRGTEKLYWNGNAQQAFIAFDRNLYILEQRESGHLSASLLVENFDTIEREIDVIYFDTTSKRVFLGSVVGGLYVLSKTQFRSLQVPGAAFDNVFYAQIPISDHSVITPTGVVLGSRPGKFSVIDQRVKALEQINSDDKRVLLKTRDGALLIKSFGNLYRMDSYGRLPVKICSFKNEIKALFESDEGDIWIGVIDSGLYRLTSWSEPESLRLIDDDPLKEITYIEDGNARELLIGTATGLYRLDRQNEKSQLVKGTGSLYIKSIQPAENGHVWLVAQGKGLMLLNGKDRLVFFPLDRKGYLASAHCVVDDRKGYLWIPTNRGLFQIKKLDLLNYAFQQSDPSRSRNEEKPLPSGPKEVYLNYHTQEEGFLTNEFNGSCQPCAAVLKSGYISLPSLKGLVWFMPDQIQNYTPEGRIILDKVSVDGQQLSLNQNTLRLPYELDDIELLFSTAYFGNRENLAVSYAIVSDGQPVTAKDWVSLNNNDLTIHLSGSRSGKYDLYVGKRNGFGKHFTSTHVSLLFPMRWYQNGWITFVLGVSALILVAFSTDAINRYKVRAIIARNAKLEEVISVRTEKLTKTLAGLEASEKDKDQQIHLLSRLIASISHDVQSPLRYMSFALKRIPELVKSQDNENILIAGALASSMSDRMSTMLEQLIDFSKMQVYGKRMKFETIDLHKLIQEKADLFQGIIEANNSKFYNEIPKGRRVDSDARLLSIIVHNLLDNAAKFTSCLLRRYGGRPFVAYRAKSYGNHWATFRLQ